MWPIVFLKEFTAEGAIFSALRDKVGKVNMKFMQDKVSKSKRLKTRYCIRGTVTHTSREGAKRIMESESDGILQMAETSIDVGALKR